MTIQVQPSVTNRFLQKLCFVDGDFVYEYYQLVEALDDLYVVGKLQLLLRPNLQKWLLTKGFINERNKLIMDRKLCFDFCRQIEKLGENYLLGKTSKPVPSEGGPYLCLIKYLNDGGWFSTQWEILSWYHTAEKGDCWNLEAFDGGTEVITWQPLPDKPKHA